MTRPTVAILGAGAMGSIFGRGLLTAGWGLEDIVLADPSEETQRRVSTETGLSVLDSPAAAVVGRDVVIIAVKPNIVGVLLPDIADAVTHDQLVVSLCAGIPISVYEASLPGVPVIRTMPNTPAAVEQAMTAYAGGSHVDADAMATARTILESVGEAVEVKEADIDAVTAISGSGPAYVFLLAEAMTAAAEAQGLSPEVARLLVNQTVRGSGLLLATSDKTAAELRVQVTSPNGTTAAALARFEEHGLRGIVDDAVAAAKARSIELGNNPAS